MLMFEILLFSFFFLRASYSTILLHDEKVENDVQRHLSISINTEEVWFKVHEPYLSFNIDSASLYQDHEVGKLNFSDPGLISIATQFCTASPGGAVLRIGGSAADDLIYLGTNETTEYTQKIHVDEAYWDSIVHFAEITQCKLVWDLCALSLRNEDRSWDSRNAKELFRHMAEKNQSVYAFQFGNEPGHWYTRHYPDGPTGEELGNDLLTLKSLVHAYFPKNPPLIIGPDVCGPGEMTDDSPCSSLDFFESIITTGKDALDSVTIHHYGLISANNEENNCNVADFTDPNIIFTPEKKLYQWRLSKNSIIPNPKVDLILGETATTGGGGCPDLSNTYASGFWWIHTLGEVAALRYDQVYRQDMVGWSGISDESHYTLAGDPGWSGAYVGDSAPASLEPNPDFYTSILWKQLMGSEVLDVKYVERNSKKLYQGISIHAHCATDYAQNLTSSKAIVLAYSNTNDYDVDFGDEISGIESIPRMEYFLFTGDASGALDSRSVRLNDQMDLLSIDSNLSGKYITDTSKGLVFPKMSYGFVILEAANAAAC